MFLPKMLLKGWQKNQVFVLSPHIPLLTRKNVAPNQVQPFKGLSMSYMDVRGFYASMCIHTWGKGSLEQNNDEQIILEGVHACKDCIKYDVGVCVRERESMNSSIIRYGDDELR